MFSHQPIPAGDVASYEASLREFHDAVAAAGIRGCIGSTSYRTGPGYSDWYLVASSGALNVLKDAAVPPAPDSIASGREMDCPDDTNWLAHRRLLYDAELLLKRRASHVSN